MAGGQHGQRCRCRPCSPCRRSRRPVGADERRRRPRRGPSGGRRPRRRSACAGRRPGPAPRSSAGRPGGTAASRRPRRGRRARHGAPPGRRPARSRTGRTPAARCCSGSGSGAAGPPGVGATSRPNAASRPWSVGRLEDDRVGLGAHRVGDRVAVLGQVADRLVAAMHPLDRPAQVDGGRAGVDERVRRAAERRPARVRPRRRALSRALSASPMAATWPMAGAPRTTISRIAYAASPADRHGYSTRASGSRRWSIEVQDAAVLAERCAEAGRGRRDYRHGPRPSSVATAPRVQDRAGGLGRRLLEHLGRAGDRRRAWNSSPAKAEERAAEVTRACWRPGPVAAPPVGARRAGSATDASARRSRLARSGSLEGSAIWGLGADGRQYLMTLVTRRPSSRSRPLRNSSSTRNARPTTSPFSRSTARSCRGPCRRSRAGRRRSGPSGPAGSRRGGSRACSSRTRARTRR